MMIVVAHAEPILDQVANHRPGPDARLIAACDRAPLDQNRQRGTLQFRELRRRAFGDRRTQTLDVVGVVPLQPAVHRAAGHAEVGGDLDDAPAVDVRTHGPAPGATHQGRS